MSSPSDFSSAWTMARVRSLALPAESLLNIDLADQFADRVGRVSHTALTARTQFLGALQDLAEKIESLIYECHRQHSRVVLHHMPTQIYFPVVDRMRRDHLLHILHKFGLD